LEFYYTNEHLARQNLQTVAAKELDSHSGMLASVLGNGRAQKSRILLFSFLLLFTGASGKGIL
jgi:hypothetical protein